MRLFSANAGLGFLLALSLLAGPVVAWAQEPREVPRGRGPERPGHGSRTFGTTSSTSHTLQAFAFTGFSGADNTNVSANEFGARFCSPTAGCLLAAAVSLPAGALVTSIELEACDTSSTAAVTATLLRVDPLESNLFSLATASTGPDGLIPGCGFFASPLVFQETIDNFASTYQVEVAITGAGAATRFQAVRVFYNLQVSPAPATASFIDVPTSHGFFQFIEALRAAGITTGCSTTPPLYCPDDPVTRGQMAVFLSKALGLHFVP
jgi:hypothetical protein